MYNCHADKGLIHNPLSTWQLYIFHCTQNIIHGNFTLHIIHYTSYSPFIHNFPIVNITFLAIKVYAHFCNRQV